MGILYSVKFRPGRYKYVAQVMPATGATVYMIGREDDAKIVAFVFDEEDAKHIILALNLVDAYVRGDTASERDLIKVLSKLRGH